MLSVGLLLTTFEFQLEGCKFTIIDVKFEKNQDGRRHPSRNFWNHVTNQNSSWISTAWRARIGLKIPYRHAFKVWIPGVHKQWEKAVRGHLEFKRLTSTFTYLVVGVHLKANLIFPLDWNLKIEFTPTIISNFLNRFVDFSFYSYLSKYLLI